MIYENEERELHRVNGPAVEFSGGDYMWCDNGHIHRYYGVARKLWGDSKTFWIFGEEIS